MSSDIERLQDMVSFMARSLVDDPEAVIVNIVDGDRALICELEVAPSDLGKVIGKDGRTARAMRTLLAATSAKLQKRAILEIIED